MVAAPMPASQTVDLGDMIMFGFGAIPTIGSAVTANTTTNDAPNTGADASTTGVRKIILKRSGANKPATKTAVAKVTGAEAAGSKTGPDTGAAANGGEACIVAAASTAGASSKTGARAGGPKKIKASNDEEPSARAAPPSKNSDEYNGGDPCTVVATSGPEPERPLKRRLRPRKANTN
ncbi:hypothetical protein TCAP_06914 [Tolypocladium capitatum]|uniref:Uncharacterized protein n=1 Tax=Tolypocladium capitatum TaxID=45235 RepID=A0A2K3Q6M4_9HYPO|nr:hypothetical protein TCAP_06914 [Tolypocladium capitatum]